MMLTDAQIDRYARQILVPLIGVDGQRRLVESRVLIVGLGGLGAPAALYLAGAGIGALGLVDPDRVEQSNLQRQVLYDVDCVGRLKTECAAERIRRFNPDVRVTAHPAAFDSNNAGDLAAAYDVVLDGTDNYETRMIMAQACHTVRKPWVYAGVRHFDGQIMTILPGRSACYGCVFGNLASENLTESCADAGIFGPVAGLAGLVQATEAVKILLDIGPLLTDRLLVYDLAAARFREVRVRKRAECPVCGAGGAVGEKGRSLAAASHCGGANAAVRPRVGRGGALEK